MLHSWMDMNSGEHSQTQHKSVNQGPTIQSLVLGSVVVVSPRSPVEMLSLWLHPEPNESEPSF